MKQSTAPEIFDPKRKCAIRARAARAQSTDDFLWQYMAEDLAERLADVAREFTDILMIGPIGAYAGVILGNRMGLGTMRITFAVLCGGHRNATSIGGDIILDDDEILPFEAASFDLVISAAVLDNVNDLPGMLIQTKQILRPDGLFLANMLGAGSLRSLKSAMMAADGPRVAPHIHPQIELRSSADLLSRAGFALPVADFDRLMVRYSAWPSLINDLRAAGLGNMMAGKRPYLGRSYLARLGKAWSSLAEQDGKVSEQFIFISLSGWSPSPDQPKPAKRGSGKISLAQALKPKNG
jgi:NADH dehydrogenase [ubiquinone] 1 alpha subcomplex assembly factor 5